MQLVDALVTSLRDWNLRYLFGVSGANIEHVHDAVYRLGGPEFQSVFTKSEIGAAFMADCRSRVHKTLGVCCATSGGGMMNLAVGVAEAHNDSVPLLAIVGQPPTGLEGNGAFQDSSGLGRSVDGVEFWRSISKFTAKITEPDEFWKILRLAVTTALSGRPGPAVLLIPRDMYEQDVPPMPVDWPLDLAEVQHSKPADEQQVHQLYDALSAARSPALLLGTGVLRSPRSEAVIRLAQTLGIPVTTTLHAKGAFPNDDLLYRGTVGVAGEPSAHEYLNEEADLIVAVGTGLSIMTRHPIAAGLTSERLIVVNAELNDFIRHRQPRLAITADAGQVCQRLLQHAEREQVAPRFCEPLPRRRFVPVLAPELADGKEQQNTGPAGPNDTLLQSEAIETLEEFLPRGGHLLFDAGNCAAAALHYLRVPKGATSTIALGMGGMGYAIAGAVGAQLGSSAESRTIVVCGDGAFLMQGMEVHTAVDLGLPILFVVFNNGMHGMCVTRQQLFFDGRIEKSCLDFFLVSAILFLVSRTRSPDPDPRAPAERCSSSTTAFRRVPACWSCVSPDKSYRHSLPSCRRMHPRIRRE